jgi:hypothetical protein
MNTAFTLCVIALAVLAASTSVAACNWRMLYCVGVPTGTNALACDVGAKFPATLSVPDGQCMQLNGTVRGITFHSIRAELQHRGFAYAKYYVDSICHTNSHVDRFEDNSCVVHPGVIVQSGSMRLAYQIAGYCCGCGNATSCMAKWRIDGNKKCFVGC